jgi:hypothetical protein
MLGLNFIFYIGFVLASTYKLKTNGDESSSQITIHPPIMEIGNIKISNKMKQTKSLDNKYIEWSSFNITATNDTNQNDINMVNKEFSVSINFDNPRTIFNLSLDNVR